MKDIKHLLVDTIQSAIIKTHLVEATDVPNIHLETPRHKDNGDFACNIAMQLTKLAKQPPRQIAEKIVENIDKQQANIDKVEIAGPGFINFYLKADYLTTVISEVIEQGEHYGESTSGNNEKVLLEYVSANPTGDLHVGHARNGAVADALARMMKAAGYDVTREFYVNDAGNQINNLALSADARYQQALGLDKAMPEDGYNGKDIVVLGEILAKEFGNTLLEKDEAERLVFLRQYAVNYQLNKLKQDLTDFRIEFDNFYSETSLYESGKVQATLQDLAQRQATYEKDGATWLKTTSFNTGDDKDRVLIKADGSFTYFTPDIAYHKDKFDRGYEKLINLFGADHHGYVPRLKASVAAFGNEPSHLEILIMQLVRLLENGTEVKMSKRTGKSITIRDLIDEVGVDAARYFLVMRSSDTHLDFDFTEAKEQSSNNPVYYAQYAHARICSILRQAEQQGLQFTQAADLSLITSEAALDLVKVMAEFPEVVAQAAAHRTPHRVANYINQLATAFHKFYNAQKIIDLEQPQLSASLLQLALATKITLKNALTLIAVNAPEQM